MSNLSIPLLQAPVSSGFKSTGVIWISATLRRVMLYEAEFGQTGTLASSDCQDQWDLSRIGATAAMTGSAVTVQLYDPADGAGVTLAMNNQTAEPTYTTAGNGLTLKSWAINQRGSYRWRALDDGDNVLVPATAGFGLGLRTLSSGFTASAVGNISFVER